MPTLDPQAALAIHGGKPAKSKPAPPMYPGGNLIDQEEEAEVLDVLRTRRLFRYYGPQEGPSKVEQLEKERHFRRGRGAFEVRKFQQVEVAANLAEAQERFQNLHSGALKTLRGDHVEDFALRGLKQLFVHRHLIGA